MNNIDYKTRVSQAAEAARIAAAVEVTWAAK
jgi:hypothetical protein